MKIRIKAKVAPLEKYKIYIDDRLISKVRGNKLIETEINSNNKDCVLQLRGINGKSELIIIRSGTDIVEYNFDVNILKTAKVGYFNLISSVSNNEDKDIDMTSNKINNLNNKEEKANSSSGGFGILGTLIFIAGAIGWFWYYNYTNPEYELEAENGAVSYISNKTYLFSEPTKSQLSCDARGTSGDITLVKCTTTLDEVIEVFESDTIWYGYIPTASGYSGYGFAHRSKDQVIRTLNDN